MVDEILISKDCRVSAYSATQPLTTTKYMISVHYKNHPVYIYTRGSFDKFGKFP